VTEAEFRYDLDRERAVLTLAGELDEVATVQLREQLTLDTGGFSSGLAIDLTEVTFMPSPAIGVLASSVEKARRNGATITLVAPEGTIAGRLLTICALDHQTTLPPDPTVK
jgi:anti-anti-sigma factor